ncbi:delta-lactam-biosynthetic de-N-acetylase, partial [Phosphitispora fastidiosa]|uniref:delta-lactam-biosynthetic de-N-acetylase n=1 Tax=Phosphitispora fastidiosa TaxID=2837202 RepID=UPI001E30975D
MQKKVFGIITTLLMAVLVISFVFYGDFRASGIIKGLGFAQEDTAPEDTAQKDSAPKDKPSGSESEGTPKESGGDDRNDQKPTEPEEPGDPPGGIIDDEPLGKTYSWWYKKNMDHRQPETDPYFIRELENRGYYVGNVSQKRVYLTFDEGYENGYTADILDILKENDVQAAFFVTGKYIDKEPELVKRMVAEGHIVGNHTENHPSMPAISNTEIKQEIETVSNKFRALTGKSMSYLRPPKGEFNSRTLRVSRQLGYQTIFWSVAFRDWDVNNQPGKEISYQSVMDNVHNGALILLHAVSESNRDALD